MPDPIPPEDEARALCMAGVEALVRTHLDDPRAVALIIGVAIEDPAGPGYAAEVAHVIASHTSLTPEGASAAAGALLALAETALEQVRADVTPPRPPGNADPSAN